MAPSAFEFLINRQAAPPLLSCFCEVRVVSGNLGLQG